MSSFSQSTNQSSSSPVQTPENEIMNQISGVASGLAQQMESWATNEFAQTSAITNQTVGNFFQVSQNMLGLSGNLTSQYNNLFAPENAQLVADANSYASPARMEADMGMAGATQAQAGNAALSNSEEALRGYGIDPSSGRYEALDQASRVQNAANVAGAENQQRVSDIATGQNLRSQAVQVGAQLPAAIANVNNTAIQANTGAENAELSNANTGVNMMQLPNQFLQTAMGIKMPFNSQQSSGQSTSNSSKPPDPSKSGQGQGGGNGAGGAGAGAGSTFNPVHGGAGGAQIMSNPFGNSFTGLNGYDPLNGVNPDNFDGSDNIYNPADGFGASAGNPTENDIGGGQFGVNTNPFNDSGFGQTLPSDQFGGADNTFGGMGGGTDTQFGNISYDPSQNMMGDTSGLQGGSWSDPTPPPSDPGTWDNSAPTDQQQDDTQDSGDGGGDFARGGAVPMRMGQRHMNGGFRAPNMASGGPINASMSPSGGQKVDDVNAHVNANEFVIPQDVALWKGQEFFQNLIMQSRKRRMTAAPAQPSQHAPQR